MAEIRSDRECIKDVELIPIAGFTKLRVRSSKKILGIEQLSLADRIRFYHPDDIVMKVIHPGNTIHGHGPRRYAQPGQEIILKFVAAGGAQRFTEFHEKNSMRPNRWYYICNDQLWERITYSDINIPHGTGGLSTTQNKKLVIFVRKIDMSNEEFYRLQDAVLSHMRR